MSSPPSSESSMGSSKFWMHLNNHHFRNRLTAIKEMTVIVYHGPPEVAEETWTATIFYDNRTFGAVGKKKQEAKDLAAKQVLEYLGVNLEELNG
ncbi:hypothetical protein FRC02_002662 [Tulasnella sp. 418]|nr:hypothetical protein FRC02_002662 [Tulasnella sp. 418]